MNRLMNFVVVLLAIAQFSTNANAQTPSDQQAAEQNARIAKLAKEAQIEGSRIKSQLEDAQRKLADIYATYELDTERASQLEAEILRLQGQLLANYRRMQTELRTLVGEERFVTLKRRIDNLLSSPGADRERPGSPTRDERSARIEGGGGQPTADAKQAPVTERVFSGPQVGEKIPPLPVRGVLDDAAGKELDFVTAAGGKPLVLVFVHEMNRPAIGLTRALTAYTLERAKDGLSTGIVWLDKDATEAENTVKRIRHALPQGVPIGISPDGIEGPGSYGLNRNVALTILVGNKNQVTANFALVQPSLEADLPKIFAEIVRLIGGEPPKLPDAAAGRESMRGTNAAEPDAQLRPLIRAVIQLGATEEAVDQAAAVVNEHLKNNAAAQKELGRIATTVVGSGKLDNYGTPRAQEYLKKWAEQYGNDAQKNATRPIDRAPSQEKAPSR